MKYRTHFFVLAVILLASLTACKLSLSNGKLTIPITLDEKAAIRLIEGVQGIIQVASPEAPAATINHIDFIVPDSIRVDGTYEISENNFSQGTMTVAFGVVDNLPRVAVTNLEIPGVENSADLMDRINQTLVESLQREAGLVGENATFKSIVVDEDSINMIVEVPVSGQSSN